jgi:perosamine synthetase
LNLKEELELNTYKLNTALLKATRAEIFSALKAEGIGVNVHYIPVHLHPFYREKFGTGLGLCPIAEQSYEQIISLPIFPKMSNDDVDDVVNAVFKVAEAFTS